MKIGTIWCNKWVPESSSLRYFLYTGTSGRYVNGLTLADGKLKKIQYYKKDLETKNGFEEVGESQGWKMIKEELQNIREGE